MCCAIDYVLNYFQIYFERAAVFENISF